MMQHLFNVGWDVCSNDHIFFPNCQRFIDARLYFSEKLVDANSHTFCCFVTFLSTLTLHTLPFTRLSGTCTHTLWLPYFLLQKYSILLNGSICLGLHVCASSLSHPRDRERERERDELGHTQLVRARLEPKNLPEPAVFNQHLKSSAKSQRAS